ncbi:hypothetical protein RRG08_025606 [Elysia crispata]|uniref:Uncharacterized protein n=1 Tax=Elysia crispata TaxID=231223 RepID=A0AAE1CX09_9GAST|nr:hypothetical protein RRG08_025606 [Elysia crispata]
MMTFCFKLVMQCDVFTEKASNVDSPIIRDFLTPQSTPIQSTKIVTSGWAPVRDYRSAVCGLASNMWSSRGGGWARTWTLILELVLETEV